MSAVDTAPNKFATFKAHSLFSLFFAHAEQFYALYNVVAEPSVELLFYLVDFLLALVGE